MSDSRADTVRGTTKPAVGRLSFDAEGRLESFDEGAEAILGYRAEEVVGKRRFSLFSPGLIAIGHLPNWLEAAKRQGEYEVVTALSMRDGDSVAAGLRLVAERRDGNLVGFLASISPREDINAAEAMPPIGFGLHLERWLTVMRAPFLTATLFPVAVAGAWVAWQGATPFPWLFFVLALLGACALHTAANVFNDLFDWRSGTDSENNEYFAPFTGGSRSLELRLMTERGMTLLGTGCLVFAALVGVILVRAQGWGLILFGLAGAFSAYFYTAPPLRLVARKGMGELLIVLNFGPLMTGGTVFALSGEVGWADFVVGLPLGLLTGAILWINQFPDARSDEKTGKKHLVVVLGKKTARWGYLALVAAAFLVIAVGAAFGVFPGLALLPILALPLAAQAARVLMRHYEDRGLVAGSAATIRLQAAVGLLMTVGLILAAFGIGS